MEEKGRKENESRKKKRVKKEKQNIKLYTTIDLATILHSLPLAA